MTLSPVLLAAIDAAIAAQNSQTVPPDEIRNGYIAEAEQALAAGVPESEIISKFNQMANPTNQ
jgi:hypothetical protein